MPEDNTTQTTQPGAEEEAEFLEALDAEMEEAEPSPVEPDADFSDFVGFDPASIKPREQQGPTYKYETINDVFEDFKARGEAPPDNLTAYTLYLSATKNGEQAAEPGEPAPGEAEEGEAEETLEAQSQPAQPQDRVDQLADIVARMAEAIQQGKQPDAAPTQEEPPIDSQEVMNRTLQHYMTEIPIEYVQRIQNMENPHEAQMALSALFAAGLARADATLREDFQNSITQLEERLTQQIPQSTQQQMLQRAREQAIYNRFIADNPDLNTEAKLAAVGSVIQRIRRETGFQGYNDQFGKEVARRTRQELGLPEPSVKQAKMEQPAKVQKLKQSAPEQQTGNRPPWAAPGAQTRTGNAQSKESRLLDLVDG